MSTPSDRPASRPWVRRILILAAALVVLYLGAVFALSRFLDPEALAAWLEPRLEETLSRDVELGRVEVALLPLGVRLQDLTVADPTGLAPELARLRSLELRVEILPLLKKEVRVSRLTVEGLVADLRTSPEGRTNFGDLSTGSAEEAGEDLGPVEPEAPGPGEEDDAPGSGPEGTQPFRLNLRSLRFAENQVRFTDDQRGLSANAEDLRLRAAARQGSDGGWLLVGSSEARFTLQRGDGPPLLQEVPLELAFDLETDGALDRVTVRTGELRLDRVALALSGEVKALKDPVRTVSIQLRGEGLPLPDLMALLPDSLRRRVPGEADGSLAANLRIEGQVGPGNLPAVTGDVNLTEGRIVLDGSRIAEALSAELVLNADRSVHTDLRGTALGGPLSVEGLVSLSGDPAMDLVVRSSPDLEALPSLVEFPEGVTAAGRVAAALRMVGPLGNLRDLRFNGTVTGTDVRATHPSLGVPVVVPEGELRLAGTKADVVDMPLDLGEDRVSVSLELSDLFAFMEPGATPRIQGSVRGRRIDLRRLTARPLPDSSLTYGKVAFAKVGGRTVGGLTVQEAARELGLSRPDSLPFAGSLDLAFDTVLDRQGSMENVQARIELGPSFVRVPDATFRQYGGVITTSADLTLEPDSEAPFSVNLRARDLDAAAFLSETTPLGRFVKGRISLDLDLIGTLDGLLLPDRPTLVGSGSFTLTGGGLASSPLTRAVADFLGLESLREPTIRDWGASFVLNQGWFRLAEATIQGAPGSPRVGGGLGLGGELDLQSAFDLPTERLGTEALERLGMAGQLASNVLQRPEVVEAILHIGGSVFDPTVQADPLAAARTLGQAVQEEVQREAQAQIDAGKAEAERILAEQQAEAQRRIQEQKDQLRNRATGFLRGLVQRPDTARVPAPPDSGRMTGVPGVTPQDTLRPDTVRPDTTRPDTTRPDTTRPDTIRPDTTRPDTIRPDTTGSGYRMGN